MRTGFEYPLYNSDNLKDKKQKYTISIDQIPKHIIGYFYPKTEQDFTKLEVLLSSNSNKEQ